MRRTIRKTLMIIPVIILLVAGIIVCVLRWKVWFGNQPEPQYEVPAVPHNIVLTLDEDATYSRIVSWRADTILKDSYLELVHDATSDTIYIPAQGEIVESRSGRAAYYRAYLLSLAGGTYSYRCCTADTASQWYRFTITTPHDRASVQRFIAFGDIQDKDGVASTELFNVALGYTDTLVSSDSYRSAYIPVDSLQAGEVFPTAMIFIGDIVERPTDQYWQLFFNALQDRQASIPVIAATGNHEYLKGVIKTLDSRWTHIFGNPTNGPQRFLGTTYFVDFDHCRFIVIDTDALHLLSDYTVMQTWLQKVLAERGDAWKIVVMHHPVHSYSKGRTNPLIWLSFSWVLQDADVVLCGHDHNYARLGSKGNQPIYILTNSSDKFYPLADGVKADCFCDNKRFYQDFKVYQDSLIVTTINVDNNEIFDAVTLTK